MRYKQYTTYGSRAKIFLLHIVAVIENGITRAIRWLEAIANVLNSTSTTTGGADEQITGCIAVLLLAVMLTQTTLISTQWLIQYITNRR